MSQFQTPQSRFPNAVTTMEVKPGTSFQNMRPMTLEAQYEQGVREEDLPVEFRDLIKYADKDKSQYIGNPANVRQPSFAAAVNGIENGDYEGLEMLDFGALADGTPAVSFLDEDNQRQVIRLTTPQWLGAMEFRSKARMELNRERDMVAKREAFKPYFNSMAKQITATNDPDIGGYLAAMYQMDPQLAMQQLGEFQRQQMKQDAETVVWRGKPVPVKFAQQAIKMEQDEYEQGERAFDSAMKAYEDQPYAAPMIENIRSLRRKPSEYEIPSTATLIDSLASQNAGPLPLVNLFHAMTKPMMTPLPQPATLPRRGQDGQYNLAEVTNFLNNFNMVSQRLGWDQVVATDEVGLSAIIDALDIANNSQGLASKVTPPPTRTVPVSIQRQQMANEAASARDAVRYGTAPQEDEPRPQEQSENPDAAIAEAIGYVKVNSTEDDRTAMRRIMELASDPARLEASTIYTPEQKAAIRRAAQVIFDLSNR
jgi:hypothetical protein